MGEDKRFALMNRLIETLGEEEARTLMESLPPVLWYHLATKDDLRALEDRLRTESTAEFARVHTRIDGLETKVDAGFESLRAEITHNRGDTALLIAKQTRTMVIALIGFALTVWITFLASGHS